MTRSRRFAQRVVEVFDWRTFAVAGAFLTMGLVAYLVFSAFQAAHDATEAANQRGKAATRRIDSLNSEIQKLQAAIAEGRDQRGQLATAVAALSAQIRQLGGTPIVTVRVTSAPNTTITITPSPAPAVSSSPSSRPTSSPTPTLSPSPSPTSTELLCILGFCPVT